MKQTYCCYLYIDIDALPFLFYRYVDVILQLIDKAGEFISDDIWFCVVQFVTNNEDLQVSLKFVASIVLVLCLYTHRYKALFMSLISPMLQQKLECILTNLLYMKRWLRYDHSILFNWY